MAKKQILIVDSCGSGGVVFNLQYIASPTNGIIDNTNGSDAIIPLVDSTNAGLMSPSMLSLLNLAGSTYSLDDSFTIGDSNISIGGDEIGGSVFINTGATGLSGDLFTVTTQSVFSERSAIIISDASDNFAMGHTGLFYAQITNPQEIKFGIKSAFTLEPNTNYLFYYFIKK